jgi:Na+-driven multidrug efflux pump
MFVTNAFFLAAWDPQTPLRSAIAAGIINLVLDLFLVNVMGWGITGAAVATVVAQV